MILVGIRVARHDDLLHPLGQPYQLDLPDEPYLVQGLVGRIDLPAAAVDDDQLRELLPLGQQTGVAAVDHLLHGGEVVRADDGLDVEVPVVLPGRSPVTEDDT